MDQPITPQTAVPSAGPDQELSQTLARIEEKVALVEVLQNSRRRRVMLFSLLIFSSAVWFIWQIIQPARAIYQNPGAFLHAVEQEETTTFFPILRYEFQQAGPKLYAALDDAFQKEWAKRSGKFPSMKDELNLLLGHVTNHLNREGAVRVSVLLDRYQKRLERDFPEIASDDAVLEQVHLGLQGALTTVIGSRLHRPFETLGNLRDSFFALPVPESYKKMSDAQIQEVMIEKINGYLNAHFKPLMDNVHAVRQQLAGFENQFLDVVQQLEGDLPALADPEKK